MTAWSEVITSGAMVLIDDVRWKEELALSPARFFRAKSLYLSLALPLLSRPPELFSYLQNGMVTPRYDDFAWVSTPESVGQETSLDTGKIGFDLMSCVQRIENDNGTVMLTPYTEATYDSETGIVTFPAQNSAAVEYELDFYKDGEIPELSPTMFRLVSLATAVVWDERFSRNFLNLQMKVKDSSFDTVNESNYMDKVTVRLTENRRALNDELRKYEQDVTYRTIVQKYGTRAELF